MTTNKLSQLNTNPTIKLKYELLKKDETRITNIKIQTNLVHCTSLHRGEDWERQPAQKRHQI